MVSYGAGIFLPSETLYSKDPNRFNDILAAEGNKMAKYLTEMDQFFLQLEETKREFDLTLNQRNTQFEQELIFNRDKLDWQSEENALVLAGQKLDADLNRKLNYDQLKQAGEDADLNRNLGYAQLRSQEKNTNLTRSTTANLASQDATFKAEEFRLKERELDMAKENNAFYKSIYTAKEQRVQDSYELAKSLSGEKSGITTPNRNPDGSMFKNYEDPDKPYDYGEYNDWNL